MKLLGISYSTRPEDIFLKSYVFNTGATISNTRSIHYKNVSQQVGEKVDATSLFMNQNANSGKTCSC